ncbi:MAG TPA: TIGR02186 family protein [Kaistia sp.]|nr:TIGR02186 family protein [Kaistia sp.]
MLASDQSEIRISKMGFEQFTFDLAHNQGLIYGLICVILAVFTGWLAGVIFRRD